MTTASANAFGGATATAKARTTHHPWKREGISPSNTKAECLKCYCWRRFMSQVRTGEPASGIRLKSAFCFAIAPHMLRKDLAKMLLERVCRDAAREGFDFVEGYPQKGFVSEARDYFCLAELYKQSGFLVHHETASQLVMRKRLWKKINEGVESL